MQAPVGFHCPVCMNRAQRSRAARSRFGAAPGHGQPVVTYAVIAACVVMYALQLLSGIQQIPAALQLPNVTQHLAYAPLTTSHWYPHVEWWRMLTSALLHSPSSAIHIVFNMIALWFLGRVIEPAIGRWRYGALLLLSAVGGSVAVLYLTSSEIPTVGASGAVFGLFGALFILMRSSGAQTRGLLVLVGANLVIGFLPGLNISWQGHLGGLITGVLCAVIIARVPRGPRRTLWQSLGLGAIASLLVLLTSIGIPLVVPYQPILP